MKKITLLLLIICLHSFVFAQKEQIQKIDSVCQLVKKYFNAQNASQLYTLAGELFKKELSADAFQKVCETNLFPLGEMKEASFETYNNGISNYKTVFNSVNLSMFISLDNNDKLQTFLFKPYVDSKAKKDYKVPSTNNFQTPQDKAVDSAVQSYINLKATTGLSIAILKDGKTYYYGYGETAKGNKQIPNENTIFEIGSISKTFTSILLAEAVDEGKVKLDDLVSKYLPDSIPKLEFDGTPVTLENLSNHSSGIPRMPTNFHPADNSNPYSDYTINDLYSFYKNFIPTRKPGAKYEYSNLAAGTLGVILQKVYGKNYEDLIVEKICNPLGMNDTRQFIRKNDSARFAKGYNEEGVYNSQWDFIALAPAGGIRSTAADLIKYAKANLGSAPNPLNKAIALTHKLTFTDGNTKVALAWHLIKPGDDQILFHNGGTGGYRSYLAINEEKKFAVVILSNTSIGVEDPGNALMKWLEKNS